MSSFMKPQIERGQWLEVDVRGSTSWIPADCVGIDVPFILQNGVAIDEDGLYEYFLEPIEGMKETEEDAKQWAAECWSKIQMSLRDFCSEDCGYPGKNGEAIQSVTLHEGYGARLSAPGYLDCTEYCVFATQKEAEEYLREQYPEEWELETGEFEESQECCPSCSGTLVKREEGEEGKINADCDECYYSWSEPKEVSP